MSNPESIFHDQDLGEAIDESLRETYEKRGSETLSAAERAEKIERLAGVRRQIAEIEAEQARREAASNPKPETEPESEPEPILEPEPAPEPESDPEPTPETEPAPAVAEVVKKAKKNSALKTVVGFAAAAAIAVALVVGVGHFVGNKAQPEEVPTSPQTEVATAVGEQEELGLHFDYSEWADFEHKSSHNAYGTDYSDCYGDDEKTTAGFLNKAESMPEALASYKSIFFEDEQKALGISDMTEKELEEFMSDVDSEEAAAMQQKLLAAITSIVNDKENAKWEYNLENEDENSYYVIWEDENSDGEQTPDEMHLGYSTVKRHNAPQANLYRRDDNGNWVKVLDLNLYCGFQPNTPTNETPTVPFIPGEEPGDNTPTVPSTPTPDESTPIPDESTPENIPTPDGSDPQPDTPVPVVPTPTPDKTEIAPKDAENLERIDNQIEQDIEDDIHTKDLNITPTDDVTKVEEITEKPSAEDYHGTEPTIVKNEATEEAEPIQGGEKQGGAPNQISPENDYSQDRGGANADNAAESPVAADHEGQAAADADEISAKEAPGTSNVGSAELNDILSDLGIN